MTVTAKQLVAPQYLANVDTVYYTVPQNTTTVIKRATFSNVTGAPVTVTVNLVPSAGASSSNNEIVGVLPIAARGTTPYVSPELAGKTLPAGSTIHMQAGAGSSIVAAIDGIEIV